MGKSMVNQNPADASDDNTRWPDWNAAFGVGVPVPDNRNTSEETSAIYLRQIHGAKVRSGAIQDTPTVGSLSPATGTASGGTSFTLTGTNLTGATALTLGGVAATSRVVVNSTTITAVSAAHAAGAVTVSVTTPGGTATKPTGYTYT